MQLPFVVDLGGRFWEQASTLRRQARTAARLRESSPAVSRSIPTLGPSLAGRPVARLHPPACVADRTAGLPRVACRPRGRLKKDAMMDETVPSPRSRRLRVAVAQMPSRLGAVEANLARATVLAEEAAVAEAELVVFHELMPGGYAWDETAWSGAEPSRGPTTLWLEATARRRAIEGSDALLIFLLKAHRPERYRETVDVHVDLRREAERLAPKYGLDVEVVLERLEARARELDR